MFLHDAIGFRHAEEVRYTDDRRRGRMWDGFIGEPNLMLKRDTASVNSFKAAIRDRFHSNNVHVDIFDRHRPNFEGADCALVQAAVYREGRPDDFLEFVNAALDRRPRRPVFEAAITYEPATGVIEVVAKERESREDLVRLFARDLLATEFRQKRLPLRKFDLGMLRQPFAFPTDPGDGIKSVRVNHLRLMPIDTPGERCRKCRRQTGLTVGTVMERSHTPLSTWFWAAYLVASQTPRHIGRPVPASAWSDALRNGIWDSPQAPRGYGASRPRQDWRAA